MKLNIRKEMHFKPWELITALQQAGIIEKDACAGDVKVVDRTEVNGGHTIIISYSSSEARLGDDFNCVLPVNGDVPNDK